MNLYVGNLFDYINEADVLMHGCNCFSTMKAGIAVEFAKRFGADKFGMEDWKWRGHYNKIGSIDYGAWFREAERCGTTSSASHGYRQYADKMLLEELPGHLFIVNGYTQYKPGPDAKYWALESCIWKVCQKFPGKEIYIPMIGSGIGGLDEDETLKIFENYPINVVKYEPNSSKESGPD